MLEAIDIINIWNIVILRLVKGMFYQMVQQAPQTDFCQMGGLHGNCPLVGIETSYYVKGSSYIGLTRSYSRAEKITIILGLLH